MLAFDSVMLCGICAFSMRVCGYLISYSIWYVTILLVIPLDMRRCA